MARRQVHVCTGCGRRADLPSGRHYCECNPRAPFRMSTSLSLALAARAARSLRAIKEAK